MPHIVGCCMAHSHVHGVSRSNYGTPPAPLQQGSKQIRTSIGQGWSNNNATEREGAMQALMSALDEAMGEAGVRLTVEARSSAAQRAPSPGEAAAERRGARITGIHSTALCRIVCGLLM